MKKLIMGMLILCMSVMTVSASYTPSAELSTKVDVVENMLMDILLESSESVAMGFVGVLESYETKFTVDMNDRNLYIVQELMYDIKPMVHCVFNGGSYLTGVRECEDVDMAMCESVGGEFNECGSACRHEEEGSICTLQCVPFCDMMPGSDLADTSDMEDSVDMETEDDMEDSEDMVNEDASSDDCEGNNPNGMNCFNS